MSSHNALISVAELQACDVTDKVCILDCRFDLADPLAGRKAFTQGHIPGARFVDLELDLSAEITASSGRHPLPDRQRLAARFAALGVDNDKLVVVYDAGNGAFAARAWWLLRWCGHTRVRLLDGGMEHWLRQGGDLESGEVDTKAGTFEPSDSEFRVVSTADVEASVAGSRPLTILDARDRARFEGRHEPIDPVAGHIPGAVSLPLTNSLREDGSWKTPAELQDLWQQVPSERPLVAMCGSGVTACHLILSASLAGRRPPALYAGSFSEWIRSPGRPVATETGS